VELARDSRLEIAGGAKKKKRQTDLSDNAMLTKQCIAGAQALL